MVTTKSSWFFMSSGRYFCPISTEVEFSWQNAPNFCPISTEVEFSWQMLPIFVRFQPKSNFLDKCSQFLSDFNQSRILLTNTPRRKLVMRTLYPNWSVIPTEIMGLRTQNERRRKMLMVVTNVPSLPTQQERILTWALLCLVNPTHFYQNTRGDGSKKQNEASHINKDSSPLWAFLLCFASAIDLLVTDTTANIWKDLMKRQTRF